MTYINKGLIDFISNDLIFGQKNKYISQCIEEIKEELRQDSLSVKANAVSKLTYVWLLTS